MKEICILQNTLGLGGAEKSLINLIDNVGDKVKIDLYVGTLKNNKFGDMVKKADILKTSKFANIYFSNISWKDRKKLNFFERFLLLTIKILQKLKCKKIINKMLAKGLNFNRKKYDAVFINFSQIDFIDFVLNKVKSKKYYVIFHSDPQIMEADYGTIIRRFNNKLTYLTVSDSCLEFMKNQFPDINGDSLYNMIDLDNVNLKKHENIDTNFSQNKLNLLFVGRLSHEKGLLRLLNCLLKIINEKPESNFKLTLVGDGAEKDSLEKFILDNEISDYIELIGVKMNPYVYMKNADLTVLPSYNESFGLVLVESMLCGTPVLATKTISAEEIVGDYGFVCENNVDDLYEALKNILDNPKLLQEKREKLKNYSYDNSKIVEKFLKFCE